VRRHPHVFGDVIAKDAGDVLANWAKLKAAEKAEKGKHGALDGIPRSAPALLRATRAGEKAGAVGFDWPDAAGPRAKVDEELRELDEARKGGDRAEMQHELGDLLFATVNLARKLGLDAEQALREATDRFAGRFGHVERTLAAEGRAVADAPADEQERLWESAKRAEAAQKG
jgi:MazG family protein